jgi:hypothetical protein
MHYAVVAPRNNISEFVLLPSSAINVARRFRISFNIRYNPLTPPFLYENIKISEKFFSLSIPNTAQVPETS